MTGLDYLGTLARGWKTIVVTVLVALALAFAMTTLTPPTYQATASLRLVVEPLPGESQAQLEARRAGGLDDFAAFAQTPEMFVPVMEEFAVTGHARTMARRTEATIDRENGVIGFTVHDPSLEGAKDLSSGLVRYVIERVNSGESTLGDRSAEFSLARVYPATSRDGIQPPALLDAYGYALIAGLVLGSALAIGGNGRVFGRRRG